MPADEKGAKTSRRDFLGLLGGALGGIALTSTTAYGAGKGGPEGSGGGPGKGGGQGGLGATPLPNGYVFHRVFTLGANQYGLSQITYPTPGVMINDNSEIVFYAQNFNAQKAGAGMGVYKLTMSYAGATPAVVSSRAIVETGQVLTDGKRVDNLDTGDTNDQGSFAIVIDTNVQGGEVATEANVSGVYLETNNGGLQPLVRFRDPIPGGGGLFGGSFGDLDLHDGNDVLVVAQFTTQGSVQGHEALFDLRGGQASDVGSIVLQTGQMIPESGGIIRALGLVDRHDGGNYVLQAYGDYRGSGQGRAGGNGGALQASVLINGNVNEPFSQASLLAASPGLKGGQAGWSGETVIGPRIGPGNTVAHVLHPTEDTHVLTYRSGNRSQSISKTAGLAPSGDQVEGISAPVVGKDGLTYYLLYTDTGMELCVTNGADQKTLLSQGNNIDGQTIVNILQGFHTTQVDSAGRIAFMAEFSNGPASVVVGIPV